MRPVIKFSLLRGPPISVVPAQLRPGPLSTRNQEARVEIFESKARYDEHLRQVFPEASRMKIPVTFVAGFEGDGFFAVSPEVYQENVPQFAEANGDEN